MSLTGGGITITVPPTSGIIADTYFNYTTVLLSGNGTNNATNATFVDSSTNNFTITRNGNTTQGTLSPYTSNWSNYTTGVSGTTNKIDVSSGSAIGGSGVSYTMEGWFYFTSTVVSDNQNIFATGNNVYPNRWILDVAVQETTLQLRIVTESNAILFNGTVVSVPLNTWVHLAAVNNNSANSFTFYINGTAAGSRTAIGLTSTSTYQLFCNSTAVGHTLPFYVSNFRIVDGSAVYTSDFTPSRSNLTAISGTKLLTFQSPTLIDNSGNGNSLTFNGTHSASRPLYFIPPVGAAYSTSTIGGSAYFDGTGDYLTAPSNAALTFGTGDFTVEFWICPTTNIPNYCKVYASGTSANNFTIETQTTTNTLAVTDYTATLFFNSSTALTLNAWTHVAVTRSGTALKLFQNGVLVGSTTNSTSFAGSTALIGSMGTTAFVTGYISDIRTLKGTALYTTTFTPPTAPLTAITNTQLLLNCTNAGIYDATMQNNLETVGDAKISTAVSKFGGSSIYFDGTGDYLNVASTSNLQFGTGDFTIEMWIYANSLSNSPVIFDKTAGSLADAGWFVELTSGGAYFGFGTTGGTPYILFNSASITTGTWFHLAVTRVGSTLTCFVNGTKLTPQTLTNANLAHDNTSALWIGNWKGGSGYDYNGYIDDLRVTKGYARYTANFTPPTAALPTQ